MEQEESLAPAVESILAAGKDRGASRAGEGDRVDVSARSLDAALSATETAGRVPVIGEVKPTSPTANGQRRDDPTDLAEAMVDGGAAAVSVLTEPDHFGGSPEALTAVREAVDVPVLRKDFVVREAQLDTVAADLVLLIVRFLEDEDADDLETLLAAARDRGFQVLVEAHTASEVEAAVAAGADLVGVNNRDLGALEVDLGTFERVAPTVPDDVTLVAESGIETPADVRRMRAAGADALLVGSAIMDHGGDGDVRANTRRLVTATGTPEDSARRAHEDTATGAADDHDADSPEGDT